MTSFVKQIFEEIFFSSYESSWYIFHAYRITQHQDSSIVRIIPQEKWLRSKFSLKSNFKNCAIFVQCYFHVLMIFSSRIISLMHEYVEFIITTLIYDMFRLSDIFRYRVHFHPRHRYDVTLFLRNKKRWITLTLACTFQSLANEPIFFYMWGLSTFQNSICTIRKCPSDHHWKSNVI